MTGIRLDFADLESRRNGPYAQEENARWLKSQADAIKQFHVDYQAMLNPGGPVQADGTLPAGFGVSVGPITMLGGSVDPQGALGSALQGQPLPRRSSFKDLERADRDELVGRARAIGVPNPEQMSEDALLAMIADYRTRQSNEDSGVGMSIAGNWARFGVAGAKQIVDMIGNLNRALGGQPQEGIEPGAWMPGWAKDVVRVLANESDTKQWLAKLDEGVRANLGPNAQETPLVRGAGAFAGGLVGAAPLFMGINAALGSGVAANVLGRIGVGAIGRAAIAGAGASLAIDAGSGKPWIPSMTDFTDVFAGDHSGATRVELGANALFGSRMMAAVTSSLLGIGTDQLLRAYSARHANAKSNSNALVAGASREGYQANQFTPEGTPFKGFDEGAYWDPHTGRWETAPVQGPGARPPSYEGGTTTGFAPSQPQPAAPSSTPPVYEPGTAVVPVNRPQGAPPSPMAALEQQFLRALPAGDRVPDAPIRTETPLNPGPPLALQGPYHPQYTKRLETMQDNIEAYRYNLSTVEEKLAMPNLMPDDVGWLTEQRDYYANALQDEARKLELMQASPPPRIISTTEDITPRVVELRTEQQHISMMIDQGADPEAFRARDEAIENEIYELTTAAGEIRRFNPTPWDAYKLNPSSPSTPAHVLVQQYGTTVKLPDGRPKLMFHGTGTVFHDLDPAVLAKSENLLGPGFYATDNPVIAGGDFLNMETEPGYANTRANEVNSMRQMLTMDISDQTRTLEAYQQHGPGATGITDEVAQQIAINIQEMQQQLESLPAASAPNVRPVYLAVKNPWDIERPMIPMEAMDLVNFAQEHPEYGNFDFTHVRELVNSAARSGGTVDGWDLWYQIQMAEAADPSGPPSMGPDANGWLSVGAGPTFLGKSNTVRLLQDYGFDAIRYEGGKRLGHPMYGTHDAYNIFSPRSVVPAFLPEQEAANAAAALGVEMSKAQALVESPALPDFVSEAVPDDATVIKAQVTADPGGFHLLRGVTDPAKLLEKLVSNEFHGSLDGAVKAFRLVESPEGRIDMLVSSLGQITDDMADQYKRTGFFENMDVISVKSGNEAKVKMVGTDQVFIQTAKQAAKGKSGSWTKVSNIVPNTSGRAVIEAPDLYSEFRQYAMDETAERMVSTGLDYVPSWFDEAVYVRLPDLMKDFFDRKGIADVGVRSALGRYFEVQRVEDAAALDPEMAAMNEAAHDTNAAVMSGVETDVDPHTLAATRGFRLIPDQAGLGYTLEDQLTTFKLPVATAEQAVMFLKNYQRDLPDMTPASPIPVEVAGDLPNENDEHLGPTAEAVDDGFKSSIADMEAEMYGADEATGDSGVTTPPPGGAGGSGGGGVPPEEPRMPGDLGPQQPDRGRPATKKAVRARVKAELGGKENSVATIMARYNGALTGVLTPMRSLFSDIESALQEAGIQNLRPWQDYDTYNSKIIEAHNEAHHPLEETGEQLTKLPGDLMRSGDWVKMWLIQDPVDRASVAMDAGWKPEHIKTLRAVDDIINRLHGGEYSDALVQFKNYIGEVARAQAGGDLSPKSYQRADDYPAIAHFVEHAKSSRAKLVVNDPRNLLPDYIRSYTYAKHAAETEVALRDTWNAVATHKAPDGSMPFRPIAQEVLDWMDVAKQGYPSGSDAMLTAFRATYNATVGFLTRAPITNGETRAILRGMQTGFYRASLGLRLHVMIRDALQPLLAIPFTGSKNLASVYKTMSRPHTQEWEEMVQRAMDANVVERGIPHLESVGVFEGQGMSQAEGGTFTPEQEAWRARWASYGDKVRDFITPGMREFGRKHFDTLKYYTRQGEWQRIISGEAAYRRFMEVYPEWRAAMEAAPEQVTFDMFARKIGLDAWGKPERRAVQSAVTNGNVEDAAQIYMRLVADRTQFSYGIRNTPRGLRSTTGRMAAVLGNFSMQLIDGIKRTMLNGGPRTIAASLLTAGAITTTLNWMKEKTGWNFNAMNPFSAALFTGGPAIQAAAEAYGAYSAGVASYQADQSGSTYDPMERRGPFRPGAAVAGAVGQLNPLKGVGYNIKGLAQVAQSTEPLTDLVRFGTLGLSGLERDRNRSDVMQGENMQRLFNPTPPHARPTEPRVDSGVTRRAPDDQPVITPTGHPSPVPAAAPILQQMIDTGRFGKGGGAF